MAGNEITRVSTRGMLMDKSIRGIHCEMDVSLAGVGEDPNARTMHFSYSALTTRVDS